MSAPKRRLTSAYRPDAETLELLDNLRRANETGRDALKTLHDNRVQRTRLVRALQDKGLTHRRIAKEVGVSDSAIQRLIHLPTDNGKTI